MADPHRLTRELRDILATKPYGGLMMRAGRSPDEFASEAVKSALSGSPFVGEVLVDELVPSSRSVELYRVYDGLSLKMGTAMTLGSWWCERTLVRDIWNATSELTGEARQKALLQWMAPALFIHPSWNQLKDIACLKVPPGGRMPLIKGAGSWKSMRTKPGQTPKAPDIRTADDVLDVLRWTPIPGRLQYFVPGCRAKSGDYVWAFLDTWVCKVPKLRPTWPLVS